MIYTPSDRAYLKFALGIGGINFYKKLSAQKKKNPFMIFLKGDRAQMDQMDMDVNSIIRLFLILLFKEVRAGKVAQVIECLPS
jgi:hypothetical protein